jgi:putative phosphoribosyl transferase
MIVAVPHYRDRIEAGQVLARHLAPYASRVDTLVLGLPRGGIPVAVEVAAYLNAPLDAFLVRKLALADNPEQAIGALAPSGVHVLDEEAIRRAKVSPEELSTMIARETRELERQHALYCGKRPSSRIEGRVVIVVDDGLATGLSMHAAVMALHRQRPAWLVVAAPVGSIDACEELMQEAHEVVCPLRPETFRSVGEWYEQFPATGEEEVRAALRTAGGMARA